jgi:hypothetical protein
MISRDNKHDAYPMKTDQNLKAPPKNIFRSFEIYENFIIHC